MTGGSDGLSLESLARSTSSTPVEHTVQIDLDLTHMVYWDQFMGENFIKCIFRYYPLVPSFVTDIFIQKLAEEDPKLYAKLQSRLKKKGTYQELYVSDLIVLRVNLKLSNLPYAVDKVNPSVLLRNALLREYG